MIPCWTGPNDAVLKWSPCWPRHSWSLRRVLGIDSALAVHRRAGYAPDAVKMGDFATGAVFSPDGIRFAFSASRDENTDIWLSPIEGGIVRRITDSSVGMVVNSSLNPVAVPTPRQAVTRSNSARETRTPMSRFHARRFLRPMCCLCA